MGSTIPQQVDLGCTSKIAKHNPKGKPVKGILPQLLPPGCCPDFPQSWTVTREETWKGKETVSSPQIAIGQGIFHSNGKEARILLNIRGHKLSP